MRSTSSTQVRAARINMGNKPLKVDSRTLGTTLNYHLATADLSRTGMKLTMGNYKRVPFNINTLLELTIDPEAEFFDAPVQCMGKVVRRDDVGNKTEEYGVHIVHFENDDGDEWAQSIAKLERRFASLLPTAEKK